jgi:membrane-associated phospholipid phosphatase
LSQTSTTSASDLSRRAAAADLALYRAVRSRARSPATIRWVRGYSRLGEHAAVWLLAGAGGMAFDAGRRRRWLRATSCIVLTYGASTSIKLAVRRRRPAVADLPALMGTPTGLSFPSTHAASSFAAARAFSALVPGRPLAAAAASMALTRLYLGVHYPSDIAAGAVLGTVVGSLGR